ncbi:MAG: HAMP domain-containing sensor histidine kinase [Pseudomonadota bacterium]
MARRRARSLPLTGRLLIFFLILLVLPFVLFEAFRNADQQKTELLAQNVEEQGRLIALGLAPILERFQNARDVDLEVELARYARDDVNLKLFYRPEQMPRANEGLFYMAAYPGLTTAALREERTTLTQQGIFEPLKSSCEGSAVQNQTFTNPAGQAEFLSSLTPLRLENGCWVLLTAHNTDAYLGASLARPLWMAPTIRYAGIAYVMIAMLSTWLLFDIRADMQRIRTAARTLRARPDGGPGFTALIRLPELVSVADELDRLMRALNVSKLLMRQAAEENAHALKTPIATIRHALEPLRDDRSTDETRNRSLALIEQSTSRLDGLVSATRNLDALSADLLEPEAEPVDVSTYLDAYLGVFRPIANQADVEVVASIPTDIKVLASEDLLETVIENVLENALSFSAPGTLIEVSLRAGKTEAVLSVADQGPGVDPANLELIFERYVSLRGESDTVSSSANLVAHYEGVTSIAVAPKIYEPEHDPTGDHFGLGLWITRRNLNAIGGRISAQNREGGGLEVTIRLPRPGKRSG